MLSRVAENIYWMARHLERAENTARLVAVQSELRLDAPDREGFYWASALRITGTLADYEARGLGLTERDATNFLIGDPGNPSSILSTVARARENIRILRETLPRESWEAVAALHQTVLRPGAAAPSSRDAHLREVVTRLQGMAGLFLGAMNDDAGYAFLRLGRAIERGDFAARALLDAIASIRDRSGDAQALRAAEWVGVLKSLTAYQMYRRSVRGPVTRRGALRFLACSTVFPRSLAHAVTEAGQALLRLPGPAALAAPAVRLSSDLAAESELPHEEARLAALLRHAVAEFALLHDAVGDAYFAPPPLGQEQRMVQSA